MLKIWLLYLVRILIDMYLFFLIWPTLKVQFRNRRINLKKFSALFSSKKIFTDANQKS